MKFDFDEVTLRCDDGAEAVVFSKYSHKFISVHSEELINEFDVYEICVEDDYTGGDYKGFFGRIKRAWRAFWDKPVVYTGIYCEDKEKMRKFLCNCLDLIDENDIKDVKTMYEQLKDNANIDDSVTSNEELIKKGEW
jgi:hypothetical protein